MPSIYWWYSVLTFRQPSGTSLLTSLPDRAYRGAIILETKGEITPPAGAHLFQIFSSLMGRFMASISSIRSWRNCRLEDSFWVQNCSTPRRMILSALWADGCVVCAMPSSRNPRWWVHGEGLNGKKELIKIK